MNHARADGTGCYHLRVHRGRAFLHRDGWDPRRYPVRHVLETPELFVPITLVGVLLAVGIAARA